MSEYAKVNFEEHESLLRELDEQAKNQPIHYSWVNVTCHQEWLDYFEIDPTQLPTVVFYYPEKELQANLLGKFDNETILDFQDRYMRGQLATWKPKTKLSQMKMT